MQYLKQSTAVSVKLGPFLDEDDGKTAEAALAIAQADIRLTKNGGAFAQVNDNQGGGNIAHDEFGWYDCDLDATDTNTLGRLIVAVHESGALPVWREFTVIPANEFDSLISGTDALQVDAVEISSDSGAADNAELAFDGTGYAFANCTMPWNAAWDAEAQSECNDALVALKLDHLVAVADGDDPVNDSIVAKLAASDGDWSGFDEATDSLEAIRDRGDAAWTTGGGTGLSSLATGTAQAGAAGTITLAAGASATDDLFNGARIALTGGTGIGQSRIITNYAGGTKVADIAPNWATNPDATTDYEIQASDSAVGWWRGAQVNALASGRVDADMGAISGDSTAADNLESYCDGTTAQPVNATEISGDSTAADNAELAFDGTGYGFANCIMPTTTDVTNQVTADATAISGDTTAADNLELMYDGTGLAAVENAIADAWYKRDWTAIAGEAARSGLNALRFLRNKWSIAAGTLTVTEEDDTTAAWTALITDDAAADNVVSVDPA